jgi:hypothetical protein
VGFLAAATRESEIYMTDVTSMVENILRVTRPYSRTCSFPEPAPIGIRRLNILDHGNSNGIEIGSDFITVATLPLHSGTLRRLKGRFTYYGFVHLQHCSVGQNRVLLRELAKVFGVSVYAGTGLHNPVYRFNRGEYVRADPDGTFATDVGRP